MVTLAGDPSKKVVVRDYSTVSVASVSLSNGVKETYFGLNREKMTTQNGKSGRLSKMKEEIAKKTEEAAIRTWTYQMTSDADYEGCGERMRITGGSLKRSLHDFMWLRGALVAEFPGVIVPPITPDAATGDPKILKRFLDRVLQSSALKSSAVFKCFALSPPSEFVASQRDFIADGAPPPLHVQATALFIKGKELAKASKTVGEDSSIEGDLRASSTDVRAALQWALDQQKKIESALQLCGSAALADAKLAAAYSKATEAVLDFTPPSIDESSKLVYGPAAALSQYRDMFGYLLALGEAIEGRENVRRSLVAALDSHRKHVESHVRRAERLKAAEKYSNSAKDTMSATPEDTTSKAKNMFSALGYRASSGVNKTVAGFASQQEDVDKAAALVAQLREKYSLVNDRLMPEIQRLQRNWQPSLDLAKEAFLEGEKRRVEATEANYDALTNDDNNATLASSHTSPEEKEEEEDTETV